MAKNDEFNSINITNEQQLRGHEFGRTQNSEFSAHNVRKNGINETKDDELNDKIEESKETRHSKKSLEQEKDLIERATETSSSSSSSASAGGTASSGAASASAAATGGASAAAASTAAAAGTVVVAAFAVVTAAPVIMSKATAELRYYESSETEFFYEVELKDPFENEKYFVTLTNETYQQKQEIILEENQEFVTGSFTGLNQDQEYVFSVVEGSVAELTRTLLSKVINTKQHSEEEDPGDEPEPPTPISEFKQLIFPKEVDFETGDFMVQLDYIDELNIFSEFKFTLSDGDISHTYDLEKTTSPQYLNLTVREADVSFYPYSEFNYQLTYKNDGELVQIDGESFEFTVLNPETLIFNNAIVLNEADFVENTFNVVLDYVDTLNVVERIELVLDLYSRDSWTYNLELTTSQQTISVDSFLADVSSSNAPQISNGLPFTYTFNYYEKDNDEPHKISGGEVTFRDSEHVSDFYGATVDEAADLRNNIFYVTLDYSDPLNKFDRVEVLLDTQDSGYYYDLSLTTEKQAVEASSPRNSGDIPITGPTLNDKASYTYTIQYYEVNSEEPIVVKSDTITFNDDTLFNLTGLTLETADYENQTFNVQLSYTGNVDDIYEFELELTDTNASNECNYHPAKTTAVQTIEIGEMQDFEHGVFSYILRGYRFDGDMEPLTLKEGSGVTFTDVNQRTSSFNSLTFTGSQEGFASINSVTGEFEITLDYADYFDYYQSLNLTLSKPQSGSDPLQYTFEDVAKQNIAQKLTLPKGTVSDFIAAGELNYSLTSVAMYSDERNELLSGTITFEDVATDPIVGFDYGNLIYSDGSYYLPFKFQFGDKPLPSDNLSLNIKHGDNDTLYVVQLNDSSFCYGDEFWQVGYFSYDDINTLTSYNVTFEVSYSDETDYVVYSEVGPLTLDPVDEYTGAPNGDFNPRGVRLNAYFIDNGIQIFTFIYNGGFAMFDNDTFEDCNVHLKFVDTVGGEFETATFNPEDVRPCGTLNVALVDGQAEVILEAGVGYKVYLVYTHSNGNEQQVLCYNNFVFSN